MMRDGSKTSVTTLTVPSDRNEMPSQTVTKAVVTASTSTGSRRNTVTVPPLRRMVSRPPSGRNVTVPFLSRDAVTSGLGDDPARSGRAGKRCGAQASDGASTFLRGFGRPRMRPRLADIVSAGTILSHCNRRELAAMSRACRARLDGSSSALRRSTLPGWPLAKADMRPVAGKIGSEIFVPRSRSWVSSHHLPGGLR